MAEVKKAMKYMTQNASEFHTPTTPASTMKKQESVKKIKQPDEQFALKYSYQIHLYPSEEKKQINGRIMNMRTERKGTFSGIDGEKIVDFMAEDLKGKMPSILLTTNSDKQSLNVQKVKASNLTNQPKRDRHEKTSRKFDVKNP